MIYRCKACQYSEPRGFLPTVTCGLYLVFLAALFVGSLSLVQFLFRKQLPEPMQTSPPPLDWIFWLILVPLSVLGTFLGGLFLHLVFSTIEYLAFARRKCPQCGNRRWTWGYTDGFGL